MNYGYARVSTSAQDLAGQVAQLEAAGCERIVQEKASGAAGRKRARLAGLLAQLEPGDVVTVAGLDRAARSALDALKLIAAIGDRGAAFRSLREPWADTTTAAGRLMVTVFAGFAEFDREMILARTAAGRENAKARGVKLGAPHKLTAAQRRYILDARARPRPATLGELAKITGAGRTTIIRFLRAYERGDALDVAPASGQVDIEDAIRG